MWLAPPPFPFFFFNDTATTEIYTLSLHDALPIYVRHCPDGETEAAVDDGLARHAPDEDPPSAQRLHDAFTIAGRPHQYVVAALRRVANAEPLELAERPRPGREHCRDVPSHVVGIGQGGLAGDHREHVDVVRPGHPAESLDDGWVADGEPQTYGREPGRLRQGLQRDHVRELERGRHHRLSREGHVELVNDHQSLRGGTRERHDRPRRHERPGWIVRVADEEETGTSLEPPGDGGERIFQVVQVRDLVDHHALLLRAGLVVPEGRHGRQERAAPLAISVEDRPDRRIDAVEGLDVFRRHERRGEGFVEPRVLRVRGVGVSRQAPDGVHHCGTWSHRALVEVQTQKRSAPLEWSDVRRERLDVRLRFDHRLVFFFSSGMTCLPKSSIDDMTFSWGTVSVAIRNCSSSTPASSWIAMPLRQLSGSPATSTPRSTSVSASI